MSSEIPDTLSDADMIPDSLALTYEQQVEATLAKCSETIDRCTAVAADLAFASKSLCEQVQIFDEVMGCDGFAQ